MGNKPEAGQIWRDTYHDKRNAALTKRTVKLVLYYPGADKWDAVTQTDCTGLPTIRKTKISTKTLLSGYELVAA